MPSAIIQLVKGPKSHTWKGRTFQLGKPQTVTSSSEILYYKSQFGFSVKILGGKKEEKKEIAIVADKEKKPVVYKEEKLLKKKKERLIKIAVEKEVPLTGNEKKPEIIEAILLAQETEEEEG